MEPPMTRAWRSPELGKMPIPRLRTSKTSLERFPFFWEQKPRQHSCIVAFSDGKPDSTFPENALPSPQLKEERHGHDHVGQEAGAIRAHPLAARDRRRVRARAPEPQRLRRSKAGLGERPGTGLAHPAPARRAIRLPPARARLFLVGADVRPRARPYGRRQH